MIIVYDNHKIYQGYGNYTSLSDMVQYG